jgi:hypothetical protein
MFRLGALGGRRVAPQMVRWMGAGGESPRTRHRYPSEGSFGPMRCTNPKWARHGREHRIYRQPKRIRQPSYGKRCRGTR